MVTSPKVHHYSIGNIYPTVHGTWRARVRTHGHLYEKNCKTIALAQGFIDAIAINHARTNRALSPSEYYDALCAIEALPAGVSLLDAARNYASHDSTFPDFPIAQAIADFIEDKRAAALRPSSIESLTVRLRLLPKGVAVSGITPDLLSTALKARHGANRNNYLRVWRGFFCWCQRRGFCHAIPTDAITRSRVTPKPPGILAPAQVKAMLDAAARNDPGLLAYLAIGFFAGLRTCELQRLTWAAITDHIHVGAETAKTREQRYVTILPNLRKWLAQCPRTGIAPTSPRKRLVRLRDAAGITDWPSNAMRHSFATYHLAAFQDSPRTSHELGHRNPDMLYRHYRNLATRQHGLAYFKIRP